MIKQPKFWTNKNFISNILLPVSVIFVLLSKIRNLPKNKLKSKLFVICIGNITIGGTGKTPTVMFLAEEIRKLDFKPIILSKGYSISFERCCSTIFSTCFCNNYINSILP